MSIKQTLRTYRQALYTLMTILAIVVIGLSMSFLYNHLVRRQSAKFDPVPLAIRSSVNFTVYYPDPGKLPAGYTLNTQSFSGSGVAVVYNVDYSGNQKLVFSVQEKPSSTAIQTFYANHLPLHTNVSTSVGTAAVGAIGSQAVVSLPTNGDAWIIVTTPSNINQSQLRQVLQAITKAS
jgi:hypothetical protein